MRVWGMGSRLSYFGWVGSEHDGIRTKGPQSIAAGPAPLAGHALELKNPPPAAHSPAWN